MGKRHNTQTPAVGSDAISTRLTGSTLLNDPLLNKASAFSQSERAGLGLDGLLPPQIETLDEQAERAYEAYQQKDTDLERHIYLRSLQDTNEVLLYRLIREHLAEMMPIIYTPVVGAACQQFSEIYRKPRGLFVAYPQKDIIPKLLNNVPNPNVEVIVVTDGERILGLGDQGTGGMGIPIGKLSLYTAIGGIDPATTLPVMLDVGTNNEERLQDPLYIGWRNRRITGDEYFEFIDAFVEALINRFPDVLLQFEDFAKTHAGPLLERYKDKLCTFNDDIQGTAAVVLGTILAAVKATDSTMKEQQIVLLGGGSAGCGISEQIAQAMMLEGLSEAEARRRLWLVDRNGLMRDDQSDLLPFQKPFAQPVAALADWKHNSDDPFGLADTVRNVQPTILIGVSGQPGLFTKEVVEEMARHKERPIIFPLSNPTSKVEAIPADLLKWTQGRALIATGSPFSDVSFNGRQYPIAQCNNSYIFPGLGLGVRAVQARRVTPEMFMAAAHALSKQAPALTGKGDALLPELDKVHEVSRRIAVVVAVQAQRQGHAPQSSTDETEQAVNSRFWQPVYRPIKLEQ